MFSEEKNPTNGPFGVEVQRDCFLIQHDILLLLDVCHPCASKFALSGSDASTDFPLKSRARTADGHLI